MSEQTIPEYTERPPPSTFEPIPTYGGQATNPAYIPKHLQLTDREITLLPYSIAKSYVIWEQMLHVLVTDIEQIDAANAELESLAKQIRDTLQEVNHARIRIEGRNLYLPYFIFQSHPDQILDDMEEFELHENLPDLYDTFQSCVETIEETQALFADSPPGDRYLMEARALTCVRAQITAPGRTAPSEVVLHRLQGQIATMKQIRAMSGMKPDVITLRHFDPPIDPASLNTGDKQEFERLKAEFVDQEQYEEQFETGLMRNLKGDEESVRNQLVDLIGDELDVLAEAVGIVKAHAKSYERDSDDKSVVIELRSSGMRLVRSA